MPDSFDKYLPWFALKKVPGIGNYLYKSLLNTFSTPTNVFLAPEKELLKIRKIRKTSIKAIKNNRIFFDAARKELEIIHKHNFKIVTFNDSLYPVLLKEIHDPPPYLTYIGVLNNTYPCLSIVGSRNATSYGLSSGEKLGYNLAKKGFQIVSGMARGIDTAAHKGALKAKGRTYAILGSGLNQIYPAQNKSLCNEISENGAVISEFDVNQFPDPKNFPIRNRIIAGVSAGTCVVEAAQRSGSLITARLAGEYCREVYAVPGSIDSKKSQGTHYLLKQGAKLVENDNDIIEELNQFIHKSRINNIKNNDNNDPIENIFNKIDKDILKILDPYPAHIDILAEKSGLETKILLPALLNLELNGKIKQSNGKYFSKIEE
ncbi:MAG: DNA-processing protein DprA [Desulfobacteraceae bacterium]|nr:DNA-processing protein DprA [Desulfobacteraceae bacterium]